GTELLLTVLWELPFDVRMRPVLQPEATSVALTAGDRLDRYEITSLLGTGGMREVYYAEDTHLDPYKAEVCTRSQSGCCATNWTLRDAVGQDFGDILKRELLANDEHSQE
ncbi:MAG TPA: hypothetical protein VLG74_16405, partial [Blastocatellia bacterium]|nr:hypothetical protein [Blastocatellia bacterium]